MSTSVGHPEAIENFCRTAKGDLAPPSYVHFKVSNVFRHAAASNFEMCLWRCADVQYIRRRESPASRYIWRQYFQCGCLVYKILRHFFEGHTWNNHDKSALNKICIQNKILQILC